MQAENQLLPLLMTVNTPHFDFASCNFTLKHMSRIDSGDSGLSAEGTGRVFYGTRAGVLRSYTLECNYNTGKVSARTRANGSWLRPPTGVPSPSSSVPRPPHTQLCWLSDTLTAQQKVKGSSHKKHAAAVSECCLQKSIESKVVM